MSVTNSDILNYVLTNRMHDEDMDYLLQDKVETMGHDAVESARAWMFGRFLHAGETSLFDDFITSTFTGLIAGDLSELSKVRDAYYIYTGSDTDKTNVYVMLFEHLIRLIISYIFDSAHMDGRAEKIEEKAQEYITAICGGLSNPKNILGNSNGGTNDPILEPTIVCDHWTDDEISVELGGYE